MLLVWSTFGLRDFPLTLDPLFRPLYPHTMPPRLWIKPPFSRHVWCYYCSKTGNNTLSNCLSPFGNFRWLSIHFREESRYISYSRTTCRTFLYVSGVNRGSLKVSFYFSLKVTIISPICWDKTRDLSQELVKDRRLMKKRLQLKFLCADQPRDPEPGEGR